MVRVWSDCGQGVARMWLECGESMVRLVSGMVTLKKEATKDLMIMVRSGEGEE